MKAKGIMRKSEVIGLGVSPYYTESYVGAKPTKTPWNNVKWLAPNNSIHHEVDDTFLESQRSLLEPGNVD